MKRLPMIAGLLLVAGVAGPGMSFEALPDLPVQKGGHVKPTKDHPPAAFNPLVCNATSNDVAAYLTVFNKGTKDLAEGTVIKHVCTESSGKKTTDTYQLRAALEAGQSIQILNLAPGLHSCLCSLKTAP